jgi:hypothetical protein
MQQLAPTYLAEIARQIGFISAFLGGVSASFVVALLALPERGRASAWAIACAAAASVAFIVAVVATTMLAVTLHPDAPAGAAAHSDRGRLLSFLGFAAGIYGLLACVGLSGWLRSRRMGRATTGLALVGAALVTIVITG